MLISTAFLLEYISIFIANSMSKFDLTFFLSQYMLLGAINLCNSLCLNQCLFMAYLSFLNQTSHVSDTLSFRLLELEG